MVHRLQIFGFSNQLTCRQFRIARLDYDVVFIVDQPLELTNCHPEQITNLRWQGFEEPDVHDRHSQLDVAHTLAAHILARYINPATVADNALVANTTVLATMTFPVLGRAENLLAEQALVLGFVRTIVNSLRLRHLTITVGEDQLGASDIYCDVLDELLIRLTAHRTS
ncbi:hypothetical protein BMS3Bbin04_00180 [bacterium BMS3Bbin04]|nr:hypothetical protein BMS3Bbin04_00180 [bacterium BMS3Bbin04]